MMDEAAAREIELLKTRAESAEAAAEYWLNKAEESERQRKALAEHLEALGIEGINAATGAGR